jgi:hypothetical protein
MGKHWDANQEVTTDAKSGSPMSLDITGHGARIRVNSGTAIVQAYAQPFNNLTFVLSVGGYAQLKCKDFACANVGDSRSQGQGHRNARPALGHVRSPSG